MNVKGVVLVRPQKHVNIGTVARSMKSFGFNELIVVDPHESVDFRKATIVAKQGKDIVLSVRIIGSLEELDAPLIGTISAKDNERFELDLEDVREAHYPEEFYLIMGCERDGLREEELAHIERMVTIPTEGRYGILNLGQATTLMLYELYRQSRVAALA